MCFISSIRDSAKKNPRGYRPIVVASLLNCPFSRYGHLAIQGSCTRGNYCNSVGFIVIVLGTAIWPGTATRRRTVVTGATALATSPEIANKRRTLAITATRYTYAAWELLH